MSELIRHRAGSIPNSERRAIFAALAQMERRLISERTHAGLEAARARGRVGGRPTVMTSEKMQAARTLHTSGATVTAIAATSGVGRATVTRALGTPPAGT